MHVLLNMLSLNECRKIIEEYEIELTDEELAAVRDWLYHTADTAIEIVEQRENEVLSKIINTETYEKKGNNLH
ncbi:MAG: hypothetical protein IPP32_02150 [Bacteroidetes bacterium]|nr:hypothetical protein [Bacteroidota bacterium]